MNTKDNISGELLYATPGPKNAVCFELRVRALQGLYMAGYINEPASSLEIGGQFVKHK